MEFYLIPDPTYVQFLLDLYHQKFSNHRIDLVIAYSAPALSFIIAHSNDLWVKLEKQPKFYSTIQWFYFTL